MISTFLFSLLVTLGASFLFWAGNFATQHATQKDGSFNRLRMQWEYQLLTLSVALLLSAIAVALKGGLEISFFGNLDSTADSMNWLGFGPTETWRTVGIVLAFIPAIGTTLVVGIQLLRGSKLNFENLTKAIVFGLPLALMNSLTEELIFRFIAINLLTGVVASATIAVVSGLAFGVPHYFGSPGKLIGVAMASFLGWVMAFAMIETNGFAISWFIHFVQDIPIIAMMLWVSFSSNQDSQKSLA